VVTSPWKPKLSFIICTHSVCTSEKAETTIIIKIKWNMVFKDIITVYKENDMKLIDMLCEQNAELLTVKAVKQVRGAGVAQAV
jgi:hypothetical protein